MERTIHAGTYLTPPYVDTPCSCTALPWETIAAPVDNPVEETVHTRGKRKEKPWRMKRAALGIGRDAHRNPATIPRASIPRKALLRMGFAKRGLELACINENGGGLDWGSFAKDTYVVEKQRMHAG